MTWLIRLHCNLHSARNSLPNRKAKKSHLSKSRVLEVGVPSRTIYLTNPTKGAPQRPSTVDHVADLRRIVN